MTTLLKDRDAFQRCRFALGELEKLFVPQARLTLVMRIPGKPAQEFVMSCDDLGEVIETIKRRRGAP